ncbi:hypothetical protein DFH94DRAFT_727415 [Russula ochroleuca]|uniref:Uncharacterized protein n=1 Tax=Russula ochroleuca TaxID=152965 RepID=A0A9P5TB61_9AGAM|nr:hypothetical protein DFH94DRAFT_727415 [Russula ochroleuca]
MQPKKRNRILQFRENNIGHIRDGIELDLCLCQIVPCPGDFGSRHLPHHYRSAVRSCSSPPLLHVWARLYCTGLNHTQTTVLPNCIRGFNTARRGVEPNRTVTWCHHDFMTIVPFDTTLSIWASCSAAIFHFMHACWIIAFFLGLGGGESKKVMDI